MTRVRSFGWLALLLTLGSGIACAKVTGGTVMLDGLEVREAPSRDSAVVMRLPRGTQVLLSKVPSAPAGWLHIMVEDSSAELRHGYVPLGSVGIMMLRTSSDAFAAAQDGAAFPDVRVVAELSTLKCKRLPRSLGRLESCVVRYAVHLAASSDFNAHALTSCTTSVDFIAGEGARATTSEQEPLQISTQSPGVEGSVEVAAPVGGAYDQAAFAGVQCRLDKVTTF